MKEEANCIDSSLHIIQHGSCSLIRLALYESHGIAKCQSTHHIVTIVNAYIIQQDWVSIALSNSIKKLTCELLDLWAIIREGSKDISIHASLNQLKLLTLLEGIVPDLAPLSVEFLVSCCAD